VWCLVAHDLRVCALVACGHEAMMVSGEGLVVLCGRRSEDLLFYAYS
jgi:hypothetical protein